MTPDGELLRQYAREGDEDAFAEVVRRHADLVYAAALRLTGGDAVLAQDAAQKAFTLLACKAAGLAQHPTVSGWLHTTARYSASAAVREERRRRAREQEAMTMNEPMTRPEPDWQELRPVLDEAVGGLRAKDRDAVLMHFFQNRSHREVGAMLGLNEDAVRKRVERALERLRRHFARRGVTVSAALLATAMTAGAAPAAPAGLVAAWSGQALASAAGGGWVTKVFAMTTKTKIALAAALVVAALVPLMLLNHGNGSGAERASVPTQATAQPVAAVVLHPPVNGTAGAKPAAMATVAGAPRATSTAVALAAESDDTVAEPRKSIDLGAMSFRDGVPVRIMLGDGQTAVISPTELPHGQYRLDIVVQQTDANGTMRKQRSEIEGGPGDSFGVTAGGVDLSLAIKGEAD